MNLPDKKYEVIYADPPWWYNSRIAPAKRTKFGQGAHGHYELMPDSELLELQVQNIADDNCALFLWATGPRLDFAVDVIKAWGFRYVTIGFTWVKTNPSGNGVFFGPGYYTASNAELCLLGVKGRMEPSSNFISQVIISPRREHSRKPVEVRDSISELYAGRECIELFARDTFAGWDVWGKEAETDNQERLFSE